jgi:ribosomal-protein-serine acetyltransferase
VRTELSSDVVRIRRYCVEDIPLLFEAAKESTDEMLVWMSWCHPSYSLEESTSFILSSETAWNQKTRFAFAVFDVSSGLFLGGVGLNQFNRNHNFANLGYWVRSSQTGRGVATAATLLAAQFGFEDLGLYRIEILTAVANVASQRVAEKAGAKREGVLRNRLLLHNSPHDAVMYSLISDNKNI